MKKCKLCNEEKELSEFYTQDKYSNKRGMYVYFNPECKECTKKRSFKFTKDNPEKRKVYNKTDNHKPNRKKAKKELNEKRRAEGKEREWQRNNKDKTKQYRLERAQNKRHEISNYEWDSCKKYFDYQCAYCGLTEFEAKEKYKNNLHKEHVNHEGSNDLSNCIPACKSCNTSKNIKKLDDWYNEDNTIYSKVRLNKINKWLQEDYSKYIGNEIPVI